VVRPRSCSRSRAKVGYWRDAVGNADLLIGGEGRKLEASQFTSVEGFETASSRASHEALRLRVTPALTLDFTV